MASILSALSSLATTAMTLLGDVCTAIVSSDLLLIFTILSLVGIGVGMFHRITRG